MLSDVRELDVATMKRMMRFNARCGFNMLVIGPAGIGKTDIAEQSSAEEGLKSVYLNLSTLEAPDLIGLPYRDEKTGKTHYALPAQFPLRETESPANHILIVDELDKAKPELQNPMLELFQKKSINGTRLDFRSVIATANMPDERAFSQPMSHALTNRGFVFQIRHDFDTWHKWAVENGVNPLVTGFLGKNTEMLLQKPPAGDDTAYCHPTPRAWTLASQALNMSTKNDDIDFQTVMVAGLVGQAAAVKFRVWLEHYRHIVPVIEDLVTTGKHPDPGMEIDRVLVCAIAGCDAILNTIKTAESKKMPDEEKRRVIVKVVENVMGWIKTLMPDMQIGAVKQVFTVKTVGDYHLMKVKPFMEVFAKIRKSFED